MTCNNECTKQGIFKNDDTGAFGNQFLRINRPSGLADDVDIYKAEFKCGNLPVMVFENIVDEQAQPLTFPIEINLTASQTKLLDYQNVCYLKVYDENGLGQTCEGSISFTARKQVV